MPIRPREYHRPPDRNSALELLRRSGGRAAPLVIGPRPIALSDMDFEAVVDLSRLGLDYIVESGGGYVHIGAMTPLQTLTNSPPLQSLASGLLSEAAKLAASVSLRRLATLAGAILSGGRPPEVLLALLALDTTVVIQGERAHEIPLTDFLGGEASLPQGEFLLELKFRLPSSAQVGGALERLARTPHDEAIVAAAAVIEMDGKVCDRVRLALAGAGPRPQRIDQVERLLERQSLTPELLQQVVATTTGAANPIPDYRASAEYRREMAGVLARRALETAWQRAQVPSVPLGPLVP